MDNRIDCQASLSAFRARLEEDEKSGNTIDKYLRDAASFFAFAGEREITKELVREYKKSLVGSGRYKERSINSMLVAANRLLDFLGLGDCRVKTLKIQNETFIPEDKELTKAEFDRLVDTARKRGDERLALILQTICGTGIRVSELRFITVEAVRSGEATVSCKGKTRKVFIVSALRKLLKQYIAKNGIGSGSVFLGATGKPVDRTTVWREMKSLCEAANVKATKVYPHNLRKLFARVFYKIEKDIAKLADILGHSSINTTRIYLVATGKEHRRKMERLGLIVPMRV